MKLSKKKKSWLGALLVAVIAATSIVGYLILTKSEKIEPIKVGEQLVYSIYRGENYTEENQVGTFTMEVPRTMTYQGARCYQANYLLNIDNVTRSGSMLFDELGRLRYYIAQTRQVENIVWVTEVTYYLTLNKMQVRVIYPGQTIENEVDIPPWPTIAEHFLYAMRIESLENGYYKEFSFSYTPNANQTTAVGVRVAGEERVEVPAGSYDSWVLETSGGYQARVWISKREKVVAKFMEADLTYVLREAKYWQ